MDPSAPTPLATFLADRDEPCPACGYNLRGATGSSCPECGRAIALAIDRPSGRPAAVLLIALLAWVLVAGGMAATRAALTARDQARPSALSVLTRRSSLVFGSSLSVVPAVGPSIVLATPPTAGGSGGGAPSAGTTSVATPSGSRNGTQITLPPVTVQGRQLRAQQTVLVGPRNFSFSAGPLTPATANWAAVSWRTWTALGYWSSVAALALIVLAIVVAARRRLFRDGPWRGLVLLGWGVFALYAGGQLFAFIRDVWA